jgi:transcription elongation factor Elf1
MNKYAIKQQPTEIAFRDTNTDWVMRITADRRIEVNEDVEVTVAAQAVLNALQHLLTPKQEKPYAYEAAMYSNDRMTVDPQTGNVSIGKQKQGEPVALPCCGYTDASAVKWNPFNGVVQCHNCGQTYTTPQQRTWVELDEEDDIDWEDGGNLKDLVKAIEAKLKEKNNV